MKKILFFVSILVVFILFSAAVAINAAKPADFGLKEGDLISAIFSDDPDVYIINDQGYKRLFLNPEIFKFYSHLGGFANIKLVTPEIRDSFPTSGFFRNCEDNDQKVYGTSVEGEDSGRLHWINKSGDQAVKEDPDFFKKVFCINRKEFNWYPRGTEFKALKEVPQYHRTEEAEKPVICHHPTDDPKTFQTIRVAPEALDAHFQHGDTKGACSTSSVQQTFPVDVKINGSDFPSGPPYDSVFIVSWTSNGAVSCRDFGQFIPAVDGGTWAKFINLPTSGTKSLYARHESEGYIPTLDIQVQCTNAAGQFSDDVIHLSVQPPTTPIPTVYVTPIPVPTSTPSITPVSITVVSPNGDEVFQKGTAQLIKWNSANVSKIYIKLRKGNDTYPGAEGMITGVMSSVDGYYKWWIPTTLPDGNDYSVRIIDGDYTGVLDDSDKQFSIISGSLPTYSPLPTPTPTSTPTTIQEITYNADLGIVDILPSPAVPEADKDFIVGVVIKNVGQKAITQPTITLTIFSPNGQKIYDPATSYYDGLNNTINPGSTGTVKFYSDLFSPRLKETTLNYPAGTYKIIGSINNLGYVDGIFYKKDFNSSNDTLIKTLEIKSSIAPTPTPTPTPTTLNLDTITISGRFVNTFTKVPLANISIPTSTGTVYSNANGEFSFSTTTTDVTATYSKGVPFYASCYLQLGHIAAIFRNPDNSLYLRSFLFDLVNGDRTINPLTTNNIALGDVPLWPAKSITVNSDVPVQIYIGYPEEGRSVGNSLLKTQHALSNAVPLEYNTIVRLTDSANNVYYSPANRYNLQSGCTQAVLNFSGGQFVWDGPVIASISASVFNRDLYLGSTGDDVKQLQALLVNEGNYPANLLTGYFGSITRDAVKKLQEKYGVRPMSGYFGEITRKALGGLISGR